MIRGWYINVELNVLSISNINDFLIHDELNQNFATEV